MSRPNSAYPIIDQIPRKLIRADGRTQIHSYRGKGPLEAIHPVLPA